MKIVARWLLVSVVALLPVAVASAVEMTLMFPQNRTTFQTNERIDVSVVRSGEGAFPAGNVTLVLAEADGQSTMTFVFGLKAGAESATDHLHLNGWMIKPGAYTLTATMGDLTAKADIAVFSHVRKSLYRTIHWGGPGAGPKGDGMDGYGEDGLGFNLMLGGVEEPSIREKMDIMGLMAMGGMHQHDGNLDCDWSDPYTYVGAIQRAMDRGFSFRTMPNAIGVHLHDEPGLTHYRHPFFKDENGNAMLCSHDIPAQRRAYASAFGKEQTWANEIDTKDPAQLADWTQINDFKLGYMDAFWRATRDSVERLKPDYLAVTQSVYGFPSTYDGYYFNVVRSMPVVSGHGGYAHFGLWNFNPFYWLEMAMPRQLDKPTWYLPGWGKYTANQVRQEQYMTFITGVQGFAQPPDFRAADASAEAVRETNHVAMKLGTIFVKPAYTRQDVTMLFSKSSVFYGHIGNNRQFEAVTEVYMATKLMQVPISVILEEDILDGSLAASHKAVIVTGVEYLDPAVIDALADFAKNGGVVLVSDDVKLNIPGATKLGMEVVGYGTAVYQPAMKGKTTKEERDAVLAKNDLDTFNARIAYARPLAKKLSEALAAKKIVPPLTSSVDTVAVGYQVRGEIEYTMAVNFTGKTVDRVKDGGAAEPIPATATITLPDTGRPVYEAMTGKEMAFAKGNGGVSAKVDFGPGDMKIFARPTRAIGGVQVATPVVNYDSTREGQPPIVMEFSATLVDKKDKLIAGTAPFQIVVKDPAGKVRFDLFRAADLGVCRLTLPMAANDAAGQWTVEVTELLSGTKGQASVEYKPLTRARNVAGATHRAIFFDADKANIYRFFRDQRNVIIAVGDSDYNLAAAERLAKAVKPYNINAQIVKAKDVLARDMTEEEIKTWCGTGLAGSRSNIKVGRDNNPAAVGWDLPHPAIVLGTPEDNVMIRHLVQQNRTLLPYRPSATFPGRGNGMVAWNLQSLGHDVQAIICVAYDTEGMSQAVGTLFEMGVGLDPLFPLAIPASAVIEVAK